MLLPAAEHIIQTGIYARYFRKTTRITDASFVSLTTSGGQ